MRVRECQYTLQNYLVKWMSKVESIDENSHCAKCLRAIYIYLVYIFSIYLALLHPNQDSSKLYLPILFYFF